MNERAYYGHESQLFGVEEYRLTGGKGDGMRLLQVRNGKGLDFTVSADRCADISRLHFRGENCGFFSANGYVAPAYYDDKEAGWLKNFTAGFLTTCGLLAVGSPCTDEGVRLPLHGAVDNIPAERLLWDMDDERIWVKAVMRHAQIFAEKLILTRTITCSKKTNVKEGFTYSGSTGSRQNLFTYPRKKTTADTGSTSAGIQFFHCHIREKRQAARL